MSTQYYTLSVIIPAYNEELSITDIVEKLFQTLNQTDFQFEVIVVDDGSTDNTRTLAKTTQARIITHDQNRGYGSSLKSGILASKYNTIAIIDADGTYPCKNLPKMVTLLHEQQADLVIGTRNSSKVHIPLIRKPAKWIVSCLAQYIAGQPIADVNSGLRVFTKKSVMPFVKILSDQFSFTTTQTLAMLCNNYKVKNFTIDYLPRKGKSKIIKFFSDIFFTIQRIGWRDYSIFVHATISTSSLLLFLTGVQILLIGMMSDGLSRKIEQQVWGETSNHFEEKRPDKEA